MDADTLVVGKIATESLVSTEDNRSETSTSLSHSRVRWNPRLEVKKHARGKVEWPDRHVKDKLLALFVGVLDDKKSRLTPSEGFAHLLYRPAFGT
nr:unnamed protein product [Spirometra erinaceieuropaei]